MLVLTVILPKTPEMIFISSEERRNMDGPLWSFGDTWILGILVVQVVSTTTGLLLRYNIQYIPNIMPQANKQQDIVVCII